MFTLLFLKMCINNIGDHIFNLLILINFSKRMTYYQVYKSACGF